MTGREAVMTVWAWDGRGQDERRVWGAPSGPRNYHPLAACRAGPGPCTWRRTGGGAEAGRSWHRTPACPPGSHPRGPEPGWGKWSLLACARCQVWCTCTPVGRGLVGTELEKQGFLGMQACMDTKVGLFACAHEQESVYGTHVPVHTWEHACTAPHVKNTGLFVCGPQSMCI